MANRIPIYAKGTTTCAKAEYSSCSTNQCTCYGGVAYRIDCNLCDSGGGGDQNCRQSDRSNCAFGFSCAKPEVGCGCNAPCYQECGGCNTCNANTWSCTVGCDVECKGCHQEPPPAQPKPPTPECGMSHTCSCYGSCYGQATSCSRGCDVGCYGQAVSCGCYNPSCYQEARACACYQVRYGYIPCKACDVCDKFQSCSTCDVTCDGDSCAQCHHANYSQPW